MVYRFALYGIAYVCLSSHSAPQLNYIRVVWSSISWPQCRHARTDARTHVFVCYWLSGKWDSLCWASQLYAFTVKHCTNGREWMEIWICVRVWNVLSIVRMARKSSHIPMNASIFLHLHSRTRILPHAVTNACSKLK